MATSIQLKLLAPLIALLVTTGCNEGGFSGSSGTGSKRLTGDAKGSPNGATDDDGNGDDDGSGMKDLDGDGVPDRDDNNNGIPDEDEGVTNAPEDSLEDGDGTLSSKLYHALELQQRQEDEKHQIQIDTVVDGKVIKTTTLSAPGKGKSLTFPDACRNQGKTCLRISLIGKVTETPGKTQCAKATVSSDKKSATVIADVDGATLFGSCLGGGTDEEHLITCPNSTELQVTGC
jgi:hypothetical protein